MNLLKITDLSIIAKRKCIHKSIFMKDFPFLQWCSCLYVCERAITELLGNADMLSPVMNIIRWMAVVTLRPDTHMQAYHSWVTNVLCSHSYTGSYTHGMTLLRHTRTKALMTDISCLCLKRLFALRQCLCLLTLNYSAFL